MLKSSFPELVNSVNLDNNLENDICPITKKQITEENLNQAIILFSQEEFKEGKIDIFLYDTLEDKIKIDKKQNEFIAKNILTFSMAVNLLSEERQGILKFFLFHHPHDFASNPSFLYNFLEDWVMHEAKKNAWTDFTKFICSFYFEKSSDLASLSEMVLLDKTSILLKMNYNPKKRMIDFIKEMHYFSDSEAEVFFDSFLVGGENISDSPSNMLNPVIDNPEVFDLFVKYYSDFDFIPNEEKTLKLFLSEYQAFFLFYSLSPHSFKGFIPREEEKEEKIKEWKEKFKAIRKMKVSLYFVIELEELMSIEDILKAFKFLKENGSKNLNRDILFLKCIYSLKENPRINFNGESLYDFITNEKTKKYLKFNDIFKKLFFLKYENIVQLLKEGFSLEAMNDCLNKLIDSAGESFDQLLYSNYDKILEQMILGLKKPNVENQAMASARDLSGLTSQLGCFAFDQNLYEYIYFFLSNLNPDFDTIAQEMRYDQKAILEKWGQDFPGFNLRKDENQDKNHVFYQGTFHDFFRENSHSFQIFFDYYFQEQKFDQEGGVNRFLSDYQEFALFYHFCNEKLCDGLNEESYQNLISSLKKLKEFGISFFLITRFFEDFGFSISNILELCLFLNKNNSKDLNNDIKFIYFVFSSMNFDSKQIIDFNDDLTKFLILNSQKVSLFIKKGLNLQDIKRFFDKEKEMFQSFLSSSEDIIDIYQYWRVEQNIKPEKDKKEDSYSLHFTSDLGCFLNQYMRKSYKNKASFSDLKKEYDYFFNFFCHILIDEDFSGFKVDILNFVLDLKNNSDKSKYCDFNMSEEDIFLDSPTLIKVCRESGKLFFDFVKKYGKRYWVLEAFSAVYSLDQMKKESFCPLDFSSYFNSYKEISVFIQCLQNFDVSQETRLIRYLYEKQNSLSPIQKKNIFNIIIAIKKEIEPNHFFNLFQLHPCALDNFLFFNVIKVNHDHHDDDNSILDLDLQISFLKKLGNNIACLEKYFLPKKIYFFPEAYPFKNLADLNDQVFFQKRSNSLKKLLMSHNLLFQGVNIEKEAFKKMISLLEEFDHISPDDFHAVIEFVHKKNLITVLEFLSRPKAIVDKIFEDFKTKKNMCSMQLEFLRNIYILGYINKSSSDQDKVSENLCIFLLQNFFIMELIIAHSIQCHDFVDEVRRRDDETRFWNQNPNPSFFSNNEAKSLELKAWKKEEDEQDERGSKEMQEKKKNEKIKIEEVDVRKIINILGPSNFRL